MKILKYLKRDNYKQISFSQCGEDLIMKFLADWMNIQNPTYLDIGTFHPTYFNNTYVFYMNGSRGVCVEPDPYSYNLIAKKRRRDMCLNVGVSNRSSKAADFYIMTSKALSTFSEDEAERYASYGNQKIDKIVKVKLLTVNYIIGKYFKKSPNIISIDTEGEDENILKSFDFIKYQPDIFCIETLTYTENKTARKMPSIINYMEKKNYFVYADTYLNTIFVNKDSWSKRSS